MRCCQKRALNTCGPNDTMLFFNLCASHVSRTKSVLPSLRSVTTILHVSCTKRSLRSGGNSVPLCWNLSSPLVPFGDCGPFCTVGINFRNVPLQGLLVLSKNLVVSHDPELADVRKRVLENAGYHVIAATSVSPITVCEKEKPSLVLIGYSVGPQQSVVSGTKRGRHAKFQSLNCAKRTALN